MKVSKLVTTITLSSVLAAGAISLTTIKKSVTKLDAATLPKTLVLKDNTNQEIKDYYSSLSSLTASERTGTNLLKNLKGIIANDVTYYSYDQVTTAYLITDRDWTNSPISSLKSGTYDESTKTVTKFAYSNETKDGGNPYIHMLYHDYTNPSKNKTKYNGDGDVSSTSKSFDNEHVWSQSHGFFNGSGNPLVGAGTDLHHLIAGTQYGNRTLHNNYSYGFVQTNDGSWASDYPYEKYNKRGNPLFPHAEDQENRVFEPQDSDKGDIARAMLYMVACYNNYDGIAPTPALPALTLKNYVIGDTTGYSSDDITKGYYGVLQDLLAWHRMDPVDEYEIHRNNIIYNTYQHNRNPFIDYPEWADYIWGVSKYDSSTKTLTYNPASTGHADLNNDVINGYKPDKEVVSIAVTTPPSKVQYQVGDHFNPNGAVITAIYDDESTGDVTLDCTFDVDTSSVGDKTVTVTYRGKTTSFPITVIAAKDVTSITVKTLPSKTEYRVGESFNSSGAEVVATYSDSTETDVTLDCTFEADTSSAGTKTVTVRYRDKTATFDITVVEPEPEPTPDEHKGLDMKKILIYAAIAVVVVIIIIGIFAGVLKVNKKGKVKINKKGVKKIVKGKKKK